MRINQTKRIFMSEVDSGSGNGAVVPASAEQAAAPQAEGAATPTLDSLLQAIEKRLDERDQKLHDKLFAAARRNGELSKKDKTPPAEQPANQQVSVDPVKMRALDRAAAKLGFAEKLSESQYKRLEKDFIAESPEDAVSWVKDYFDGFGFAQATQPAQTQVAAPAQKPATEHPLSNRGAPPPAQVPLEELDLWTASESDRAAFIKSKGTRAYVEQLRKQGKGRPVQLR